MDGIGGQEAAMQTRHSSLETLREYQRVNVIMGYGKTPACENKHRR
jgi:hypothetical protein